MAGESSRRASVAETNAAKKEKFFSRSVYTRIPYGTKNGARKKERKEGRKEGKERRFEEEPTQIFLAIILSGG